MSKPITSAALMTLYEEGLFQLSDPLWLHLGDAWKKENMEVRHTSLTAEPTLDEPVRGLDAGLVPDGCVLLWQVYVSGHPKEGHERGPFKTEPCAKTMTIVDVLTHSSGLSYGFDPEGILNPVDAVYAAHAREMNGVPLLEWSDKLAKLPLFFQPQAAWHCAPPTSAQLHMRVSNHDCADGYNTDVCGALVEKISGMPFEEYLRQKIFSPLGMVDTAFWVPPNKRHRFADVYSENPNPAKIRAGEALVNISTGPGQLDYIGEAPPVFSSGGGGLVATMHDCACSAPLLLRLAPLCGVC